LTANYNARMDNEALQQQLQEMEQASEEWRAEKRRLNVEIDKLESALADAKTSAARKRVVPSGSKQKPDTIAFSALQEVAEDRLKKASDAWDAERAKLLADISRLETAVADAIARASNPLRATQSVKEQFEGELNRVAKEKIEVEQAFLRAKTQWEQEKLKMTGEMVKLRRAAQIMGRPVPKEDAPEVNPKVRDIEKQLKESLSTWNAERLAFVAQIHKLEESARHWETERRQLHDHAGQLQEAFMQAQVKINGFEAAARTADASDLQAVKLRKENESMERQTREERNKWEAERRALSLELERAQQQFHRVSDNEKVSKEVVAQLRQQYDQKLHEAIRQKTELATQLQSASALLEAERTRLSKAQRSSGGGQDSEAIAAEVSRVEQQLSQIIAVVDNPDTELSTIIRKNVEKAELDAYLKGILFCLGRR
jgi:hypothetical protein